MNKRLQIITALAAMIGLLGACGGGSGSSDDAESGSSDAATTVAVTDPPSTDPDTNDPETTDPPTTEPPTTDGPATDPEDPGLPEWASGEMVTVGADTGPLELPVELARFCESSRSFYVAAKGLVYVGEEQVGTAQQLFAALDALIPAVIESAPSDDFATEPIAARDQLAVIIPALEQAGYDRAGLQELPDRDLVLDTLEDFGETRDSLQEFLVQACGADVEVLDEQARDAAAAAAEAAGEVVDPVESVEAATGVAIANDDSTITLSVPVDWTDTDQSTEDGRELLSASADLESFFDLAAPGVLVLRGEGGFRDGGFVGRVLEFEADLLEAGCVATDESDYDDNTYSGQERTYECGTEGLEVRLFGGATADESLYAMVLLVSPTDEPGIRQLIVETFLVA